MTKAHSYSLDIGFILSAQEDKSYSTRGKPAGIAKGMIIDPRKALAEAALARGFTLSELSKKVDKNHAYLQQFIRRGTPATLPENVRMKLAAILGISEEELGGPDRGEPEPQRLSLDDEWREDQESWETRHKAWNRDHFIPETPGAIPEIDVEIGAGEGKVGEVVSFPLGGEAYSAHRVVREWVLPSEYLAQVLNTQSRTAVVMPIVGDSMSPTYQPGDRAIIDLAQNQLLSDTVYAISDGFSPPQLKRLERVFGSNPAEVHIISDNPAHTRQRVPLSSVTIIGRIVGVVAKK